MIKLMDHQKKVLDETRHKNKVAYYLDMGLGKTYIGTEKMIQLGAKVNLIVCQKSKVDDWYKHIVDNYSHWYNKFTKLWICNLTKSSDFDVFFAQITYHEKTVIGIINYDLIFRRPKLLDLKDFTLMLDESSCIQNETSKRSKSILKMNPSNVILLSGTPTSGKYERLYSQLKLLGWEISKKLYQGQYIEYEMKDIGGFKIPKVIGYKNVPRLKNKLKQHGAIFMKTEEVLNLPEQIDNYIYVTKTKEYNYFMKHSIINIQSNGHKFIGDSEHYELIGDTTLTKRLYLRMLASGFNYNKLSAFSDILESTDDRLIVFYTFNQELTEMRQIANDKPVSIVNGEIKDLENYKNKSNSITFVQYQAGAMGLNLQKANKIIYFSLTERSDLFEQSKKRIHRIGQKNNCSYYYLLTKNSIDIDILENLKMRRDYTDELFKKKYL